ncbi:HotDog domain-containing protein [Mycotypha africana]|uniref:HotDog domain-containing protein n=1 Tax=Mycotypha africana TaxID=64632 RepID=UPI002300BAA3|nr:HotDog domain-containing protein [Mycotypha africana]KAI8977191.1 HotDog domain-containing protein [Mycotypha africana]
MKIEKAVAQRYPQILQLVEQFNMREGQGAVFWEDNVIEELHIVGAEPDKLIWEFKVKEVHCNRLGNLHGGCAATLIDICSSFAVLTNSGKARWNLIGVSTDLSVSYLKGVPAETMIRLECEVQRVGKTLANIFTKVYNDQGQVCYTGSHTKFNIDPKL